MDAGFGTAGFIVLATACRPLGGMLSDWAGGTRILSLVFPVPAACALLMARPVMDTFTIGALGMAAAIGACLAAFSLLCLGVLLVTRPRAGQPVAAR